MRTFLGLISVCSLLSPFEGLMKGNSPGILVVVSPRAFSKYISTIFLRNRLFQSYLLAIQFPPGSPPTGKELGHSIKGLHVVKVYLPIIFVELKGNGTAQVQIKVRLHFGAQYHFSHHFERLDFIVDMHFMADVCVQNYSVGIFRLKYEPCETHLTIAQIIGPSYIIKAQVRPMVLDLLIATLPNALCQAVETVGDVALFDFLYTANAFLSIRSANTLQYQLAALPWITPVSLAVGLNVLIRTARRFVSIPPSRHVLPVPSLNSHDLCLVITQGVLNGIFSVVIQVPPQEFITTPQVFSGSAHLIDAVAVLLFHQKCPKCPEKSPLKILLRVVGAATITLQPQSSHLRLTLEIPMGAQDALGIISELFVLKANVILNFEMAVHENRLIFYTTLSKLKLFLISSDIGHFPVAILEKWIHLLLVEMFMPRLNDCLTVGIPVPSLLNINLDYPKFLILQGSFALCV